LTVRAQVVLLLSAPLVAAHVLVCAVPAVCAPPAPREIAGFRLGADVASLAQRKLGDTTEVDLTRPYLTTVALAVPQGFRSGYATYASCLGSGSIVRLKLNYADDSRAFHDSLVEALKARYGAPKQWRGNPFGSLRVWKWSFHDAELGNVSLVVEYYSGEDDTFTKGNSIRLTATGRSTQERDCWLANNPVPRPAGGKAAALPDMEAGLPH
jgi:hypothetical protein